MLARQLLVLLPFALLSLFMVLTGSGLFWTLMSIAFVAIIIGQLVVRQWSLPKSVGISDQGVVLRMLAGDVTYEWREVVSVSIRSLRDYGHLIHLSTRLGGIDPSQPFVHVELRHFMRLHPFGIALPGRVPFVRSLGFILNDAEAFVAAARAHMTP